MAKRKVNWSTRAKRELNRALAFYTGRNGNSEYSLQILDELEDLTKTFSRSHFIGRLASDRVTRVIPFKVFLVFYQVQSK